jgi:hypothetical protein
MKSRLKVAILAVLVFTVRSNGQSLGPTKIDEFETFLCDDLKARTENLYLQVIKTDGARGYIIVYEGKYRSFWSGESYLLPHIGEADSRIRAIKTQMRFLKISKAPIKIVFGGYREHLQTEYFLIPPGATEPKPSPSLKRIKHRKGRAIFRTCPGDC